VVFNDNANSEGNSKRNTSTMTMTQAEKRLLFRLDLLDEIPVAEMLRVTARKGEREAEQLRKTKKEQYLRIEGKSLR